MEVSTHAPARGATNCVASSMSTMSFQPTHPHGVRLYQSGKTDYIIKFQPTHPHGVRLRYHTLLSYAYRFNPRTRTGCDLLSLR